MIEVSFGSRRHPLPALLVAVLASFGVTSFHAPAAAQQPAAVEIPAPG